jgi:hypothetical protein
MIRLKALLVWLEYKWLGAEGWKKKYPGKMAFIGSNKMDPGVFYTPYLPKKPDAS